MESRFTPFMFCCCHCSLLTQKCWVLVRSCQRSQGFIPEQFFHTGLKIKAHQDRKCSIEKQIPFILSKKKKITSLIMNAVLQMIYRKTDFFLL